VYSNIAKCLQIFERRGQVPQNHIDFAETTMKKMREQLKTMGFDPNHLRPAWTRIPEQEALNFFYGHLPVGSRALPRIITVDLMHTVQEGCVPTATRLCATAAARSRGVDVRGGVSEHGNRALRLLQRLMASQPAYSDGRTSHRVKVGALTASSTSQSAGEKVSALGLCLAASTPHVVPDDVIRQAIHYQCEMNMLLDSLGRNRFYTAAMCDRIVELGEAITKALEPFKTARYVAGLVSTVINLTYKQHVVAKHLKTAMETWGALTSVEFQEACNKLLKEAYENTPRRGKVATYMLRFMLRRFFLDRVLPRMRGDAVVPLLVSRALLNDHEYIRLAGGSQDPASVPQLPDAWRTLVTDHLPCSPGQPPMPVQLPPVLPVFGGVYVYRTTRQPMALRRLVPLPAPHDAIDPDRILQQRCTLRPGDLVRLCDTALAPKALRAPPPAEFPSSNVNLSNNAKTAPLGLLVKAFYVPGVEGYATAEDARLGVRRDVGDGGRLARKAAAKAAAAAAAAAVNPPSDDEDDGGAAAGPHPNDGYHGDACLRAANCFALLNLYLPFDASDPMLARDKEYFCHSPRRLGDKYVVVPISHIWGKVRFFKYYPQWGGAALGAPLGTTSANKPIYRVPDTDPRPLAKAVLVSLAIDDPFPHVE
jgi:hypothetical protein